MKFKGESNEYRKVREQLLEAEIALKDQRERVAVLRRQLPMGALVETDYVFREGPSDIRDESPANLRPPSPTLRSRKRQSHHRSHDVGSER